MSGATGVNYMQIFSRLAVLAAAGLALAAGTAAAQTASRDEIEKIVREYILKNPEIVRDAIIELRRRDEQAETQQRSNALKSHQARLFNSPRGVVVGNPKGNVTLVEFFDYNCGYCKKALGDIGELLKNDPNLKIVFKELPILSPGSVEAARVSIAVRIQDPSKYFAFHRILLGGRGEANAARALAAAKEAGLDIERIKKDMNGPEVEATLQESAELAEALKVSGTPTYVLADQVIPGALPYERLSLAIAAVRKCGKVEC
jgi:protein-disulfide isomerase